MQYVVQVGGEVLDTKNKAYVVDSKTVEDAQLKSGTRKNKKQCEVTTWDC